MDLDKEIKVAQQELQMYIKCAERVQQYLNDLIELKGRVQEAVDDVLTSGETQ